MKYVLRKLVSWLLVLLMLLVSVTIMKSVWTGQQMATAEAKVKTIRRVLPDAALQRKKILEELQMIRHHLAEIHKELKSGELTFNVVPITRQKGPARIDVPERLQEGRPGGEEK
ncbi:MAG: hypothetical protein QGD94_00920 [Planctomycetia bacterium]|nr:hypothetical protein [Planctomycetia bacterium]